MSGDYEREIRDCLGGALGTITPVRPPVSAVVQQGRVIRMRRRIGAAAGLAVIVGAALALPGVLRPSPQPVPAQHGGLVTVSPPSPGAPAGLIATGTINGKPWQVRLSLTHGQVTAGGPGLRPFQPSASTSGDPAGLDEASTGDKTIMAGPVQRDVTHVTMNLSGGSVLDLRPVVWHGRWWVAAVLPTRLPILRVTAYSRSGELSYAIPFGNSVIGWLRPGQPGPARATYTIGSGAIGGRHWAARAHAGPWGLCLSAGNSDYCMSATASALRRGELAQDQGCGSFQNGGLGLGAVALRVRSVRLGFSDGSTVVVHPVAVGRFRAFAFTVAHGLRLTGWTAYGAPGQELGSGSGRGWSCNSY
jgi:hypothetical protein